MEENAFEIKEVNEREFLVGESRMFLDEDRIITTVVVGETDEKKAIAFKEILLKLVNMAEGKICSLVDLNRAGKATSEARKIGQEMFYNEKTKKVALFGLHPVARVLASFVMRVTHKKDMRFFKTKEEALAWLKE